MFSQFDLCIFFAQVESINSICLSVEMDNLNSLLSAEAADGLFGGITQHWKFPCKSRIDICVLFC